jgi:hypothetical protein
MFLAPLSVPPSPSTPSHRSPRASRRRIRLDAMLIAWLAIGCAAVLLVPAMRGGRLLGATLPFWLVAAPLVDLAWLSRRDLARIGREITGRVRATARPHGARRLRRPAPRLGMARIRRGE